MPASSLRPLAPGEVERIYQTHMTVDFPPAERKPLSAIQRMQAQGIYETLGAFCGDRLVGYAFLTVLPGQPVALLDYLAVLPAERGSGWGTQLLAQLKERYTGRLQSVLIESEYPPEAPEPVTALRRLYFYRRGGARITRVINRVYGVRYVIFSLDCAAPPLSEVVLQRGLEALYRQMIPSPRFERHVLFGFEARDPAPPCPWEG